MICCSGGATGSDYEFGRLSKQKGIELKTYSFAGHRTKIEKRIIIPDEKLKKADPMLKRVNSIINRVFPSGNSYVNKLLRRDFFTVRDADLILAVANFTNLDNKKIVTGGTAWGVYSGILLGKQVIILNNQTTQWFKWSQPAKKFIMSVRPIPELKRSKVFAGIGTRGINRDAIWELKTLFDQVFKTIKLSY